MASQPNPESPFVQEALFEDPTPEAKEPSILDGVVEVVPPPVEETPPTMEDTGIDEGRSDRLQDAGGFTVGRANAMSGTFAEAIKDKKPKPDPNKQKPLPPRSRRGFSPRELRIADSVPNFDPKRRW